MTNCNKNDCTILDQYNECKNCTNASCLTGCGFSEKEAQAFFSCIGGDPNKDIPCLDKLGISSTCVDYINDNEQSRSDCGGSGGDSKFFTTSVIIGFSVGGGILAFLIILAIILYIYKKINK